MIIHPIPTSLVEPGQPLLELLDKYLSKMPPRSILAITSKIISLCENRCVDKNSVTSKQALIQQEADYYLEPDLEYGTTITLKDGLLLPTAGIDESNTNQYVLYPEDVQKTATTLWHYLKDRFHLQEVGVIITDSRSTPLRRGTTGIALGWCGFQPFHNYIGQPDLLGKPLKITVSNLLDGLASAAVLMMGEGNERTPMAMIEDAPRVAFQDRPPTLEEVNHTKIPIEKDLYRSLFNHARWKK